MTHPEIDRALDTGRWIDRTVREKVRLKRLLDTIQRAINDWKVRAEITEDTTLGEWAESEQ